MGATNRKPLDATIRPPADQPGVESFGPVLVEPARKKTSMRQAVAEARREIAAHLPAVVCTLAKHTEKGSVNHLKLFLELSGVLKGGLAAQPRQARERTLEEIMVEQWERDQAITAADQMERARARAEEVLSGL